MHTDASAGAASLPSEPTALKVTAAAAENDQRNPTACAAPPQNKRRKLPAFGAAAATSSSSSTSAARKLPRFDRFEAPDTLPSLPLPARVANPIYTRSEGETDELCEALKQHSLLGFDIEWKVTYESGTTQRPAATVQLSTAHTAFVIQISSMRGRFPSGLAALLQDGAIVKAGCKVGNDALKLRRDFGVRTRGLCDLGQLATHALPYGERPWNLADLVLEASGRRLPKELRLSDWEASRLSAEQLTYAARDAYASRLVCVRLLSRLKPSPPSPPPLPPTSRENGAPQEEQPEGLAPPLPHPPPPPLAPLSEEAQLLRRMPRGLIQEIDADPMEERRVRGGIR